MAEMAQVPHSARTVLAAQFERQAVEEYQALLAAGHPPAVAGQMTSQHLDQLLTDEAARQNVTRVRAPIPQPGGLPDLPAYPDGVAPPDAGGALPGGGAGMITGPEVKEAYGQYQEGVRKGNETYDAIRGNPTDDPNAAGTFKPVVAGVVDPQQVARAERLTAALQGRTTVAQTDTRDLQASAQGTGAAQLAQALRDKAAIGRMAQVGGGLAAQARGSERRGARALGIVQGSEQAANMLDASAAREMEGRLAAQTKVAEIDASTKQLQAQLDQARAAGDQNAINTIQAKMAELDQQRSIFNVGEANKAATGNVDRAASVATSNNAQGLAANVAGSEQSVKQAELRLKIQDAVEKSAQGLLNEAQRQELIDQARTKLDQAQQEINEMRRRNMRQEQLESKQQEINGWLALLQTATSIGTAVVTKTSDRRAKTDIKPVKDRDLMALAEACEKSLSTYRYKKGEGKGDDEHASAMAQSIRKTKLGKKYVVQDGDSDRLLVRQADLAMALSIAALKRAKGAA